VGDKASPQNLGTTINFTASATGGVPPYQFKWWLYNGASWSLLSDWSASNSFAWAPPSPNPNYQIAIWARSAGNAADRAEAYRALAFSIGSNLAAALAADKPAPQNVGTTITFTASGIGGIAPYQFKWWLYNGASWSLLSDWSASNTFAWTPTAPNANYQIAIWARSAGNPEDRAEAYRGLSFPVGVPQVRFLNNLVFCTSTCQGFTARLTAAEGYSWTSFSGVFSPYQNVASTTLSNFTVQVIESGQIVSFPGVFHVSFGRRYLIMLTLDASNNPVLQLVDEGSLTGLDGEQRLPQLLPMRPGDASLRFAPALSTPSP